MPVTSTHLPLARDVQASLDLQSYTDLVRTPVLVGLLTAVAILLLAAGPNIDRPGFSSDEEITALTVQGVAATGLPVLPSGILYFAACCTPIPLGWAAACSGRAFRSTER